MRSIRNQPFCWQEKKILRFLKTKFTGQELAKYRNLYLTLSEIDSDFNGNDIKYYTKTIAKYSGLSIDWIPRALKKLQEFNILVITDSGRDPTGMYLGNAIIFTPENINDVSENINDTEFEVYVGAECSEKPDTASAGTGLSNVKKADSSEKPDTALPGIGLPDTRLSVNGWSGVLENNTNKEELIQKEEMKEINSDIILQNNILKGIGIFRKDKEIKTPLPPFASHASQKFKKFDEIILEFTENEQLRKELKLFTGSYFYTHKIRLGAAQFEKCLATLKELSDEDENKMVKIVSLAIESGWKRFYPLKEEQKQEKNKSGSFFTKADKQSYEDYNYGREHLDLAVDENGKPLVF